MKKQKTKPQSKPIKVGDIVFVVPPTRKKRSFPDGVFKGKCVAITNQYQIQFKSPWGITSGWYWFEELGHDEKDWSLKR